MLSLEQVYGAITYYLSPRRAIDAYLRRVEAEHADFAQATRDLEFLRRLAQARRQLKLAAA